MLRVKPEFKKLSAKYSGKGFAFFHTESSYDSNYFPVLSRVESAKSRSYGIGFGGSGRKNCKLWIDQDIGRHSFVGFKGLEEQDDCLVYALDRLLGRMQSDLRRQSERREKGATISSKLSDDKTLSLSRDETESFAFQRTAQGTSYPFNIEIISLEAWALTNAESFEHLKNKLIKISNFNHYDKMIEVNCGSGIKDAEVLIENSEYFTERE